MTELAVTVAYELEHSGERRGCGGGGDGGGRLFATVGSSM